jgi:hypothetical protein
LGGRRYSSYSFSTSALDGGEWSASRPGRAFTPGDGTPGTHCTGGWVGPRAVRTSKKTQSVSIKNINWLLLFKDIIAVYRENLTKLIKTLWENWKVDGR